MPNFSKQQLEAINHNTGPALVVAGPGSGKTAVIVNRIHTLIHKYKANPEKILVITFSKMAAMEMQSRFCKLCDNAVCSVQFGTFHSVFFKIISQTYRYNASNIASINEIRTILKQIVKLNTDFDNEENEFIDSLYKRISFYKNSNLTDDDETLCEINKDHFLKIFNEFKNIMSIKHKLDFDDMLLICYKLLKTREDVRKYYHEQYRYILVDEYQDINNIQYEVLKLLVNDERNIFAVGDDDQAIYGFRGSKPEIMARFSSDFKGAKVIYLSFCYRCNKNIMDAASMVVSQNKIRFSKDIKTVGDNVNSVTIIKCKNKEEQYNAVIDRLVKDKFLDKNCAILFRTNSGVASFVELLINKKIKCSVREVIKNPYDSIIFKDFCHYYQLAHSDALNLKDFLPIMNKPLRYLSRNLILNDEVSLLKLRNLYEDKSYMTKIIDKLDKDLKWMKKMDLNSSFHYFRKVIGYENYLRQIYENKPSVFDKQIEIMDYLQERLEMMKSYDDMVRHVNEFSRKMKTPEKIEVKDSGIYVMTYHASKGLEFDNVFLPDINEGEVPNKKSITDSQIEEERRMLYVAMTRAKNYLNIYYVGGSGHDKGMVSRFIRPLLNNKS